MIAVTHILFLSGGNGKNAISGAERHVMTLVQELASRGVDTELVVLLWNNDAWIEMALAKLRACAREKRLGGNRSDAESTGDFLVRQSITVLRLQRVRVALRNGVQGMNDRAPAQIRVYFCRRFILPFSKSCNSFAMMCSTNPPR